MALVQCGARRSGNYLLWSIARSLLGLGRDYDEFLSIVGIPADPLWFTHELPEKVSPPGIYVVRDGRDAVVSMLHFVVTPEYRRRYPECTRTRIPDLLEIPGFFERRVLHWKEHARSYLRDPRPWHLVRYEELAGESKPRVVRELADRMGVAPSEAQLRRILQETSLDSTRARAPGHVRAGGGGGYATILDEALLATFHELAGEELEALGYRP